MGEERLVKLCMLEKVENEQKDRYSLKKRKCYNDLSLSTVEVECMRIEDKSVVKEVIPRILDIEIQVTEGKIRESRCNPRYVKIMIQVVPKYFRMWNNEKEMTLMARLRCGNLEEKNRYWTKGEERYFVKDCVEIVVEVKNMTNNR